MIIKEIKKDTFTKRRFAEKVGMNKSTIEEDLKELKEKGMVEFIGSKKGGEWRIKNDKPENL